MADVLACLKRSVVLLIGQHALYLRLPDQDPAAKVHRIKEDELHKDLLAEKDKPLYSKYKLGIVEYGPRWEEETQREVRVISRGMEKFAAGRPEVYIKYANDEIESKLYAALPPVRLPDRERASSSDEEPVVLPPPPIIVPNPALRCDRLGTFRYPPSKRLRTKSKPEGDEAADQALPTDLEALARDAEMAAADYAHSLSQPDDVDFEADAEAATFMHE